MKSIYWFTIVVAVLVLIGTGGCSMKSEHLPQINSAVIQCPEGTPPDEQCVVEYRGPAHLMGGGRNTALFVKGGTCTERDPQGNLRTVPCGTVTLGAWNAPDRVDVILPPLIGAGGDVLSAYQIRKGQEYGARKAVEASKNAAPGLVLINDVKGGSGGTALSVSESGAIAGQSTTVGVGVDTGCGSGNCYDPTQ